MKSSAVAVVLVLAASPSYGQTRDARRDIPLDSLLQVEVSTAARHAQTASQAPASVTVITSEDIERFGDRTLADVLQRLRGFYTSNDRNYTYLGARGFSRPTDYNNRVLLMLDGIPLNEGVFGAAPIGTELSFNLDALERIEVVRGPASALYGTGAMLAVVNLIPKRGADVEGLAALAERGSAGAAHGGFTYGRTFGRTLDVLVAGRAERSDGEDLYFAEFDSPESDGMARGRDWDEGRSGLAIVRYGDVSLRAFGTVRAKGIPTGAYTFVLDHPDAETKDGYFSVALGLDRRLTPALHLSGTASFFQYGYSGSYPSEVTSNDTTMNRRFGAAALLGWDIASNHRLAVGGDVSRDARADYRSWYDGAPYFRGDFPYTNASLYIQHEAALTPNLTVTLGVRHDRRTDHAATTTPRAALLFSPGTRRTLKLLYGEAFRAPNVYERYYEDVDFTAWPGLRREHVSTLEGVWQERLAPWLRGELSVFSYRLDDLIDTTAETESGTLHFENRASARTKGVEAELEARLPAGGALYANYSYQRAEDRDTHEPLTNSPAHLLKLGGGTALNARASAMAEVRWESERTTVYGGSTDAYVHARGGVRFSPFARLDTWLTVENLFDTRYATPGGYEHLQPAIEQDGRRLKLGLGYRF